MRASTVEVLAYEEDKAAFNRVKKAMGVDWVKNEFHTFMNSMTSKVDATRVAASPTNEVVGVENEGAEEEEVRHEAVAKEEEVRKEADFEVAEPKANSKVKLSLRRRSSLKLSLRRSRPVMKLWLSVHFSYCQEEEGGDVLAFWLSRELLPSTRRKRKMTAETY